MRTHLNFPSHVLVHSRINRSSTLYSNWFSSLNHQKRMQSSLKNSSKPALRSLAQIKFDNRSLQELPVDSSFIPSQREVPNAIFALVDPTPLENSKLIAYSKDVAENLLEVDLEHENLEAASKILAGCDKTFGRPAAHCYCGHQFGVFAGQLGDGATMYIGETVNSKGERWEMQYKGAGLTPFSRQADGRKVLRSSIREFLCSEHLHALGIPTTRALSICTSDSTVVRDILYDGHPRRERCSVIIRVCETFFRFGSFEIARPVDAMSGRAGPNYRRNDKIVPQLYDYVTKKFYPEVNSPDEFVLEVSRRTARLVALWQTMGWCHGVLNTDNMSILGKTIDYGPFGFMERFDEGFICNRSDDHGRYAYSEQPSVCLWNCFKLLEALANTSVKFKDDEPNNVAEKITEVFFGEYKTLYRERMCAKLGIEPSQDVKRDFQLFDKLFKIMNQTAADFTQVFRGLAKCESKQKIEADFERFIAPCLGDVASLRKLTKPRFDPQQIRMLQELIDKGKAEEVRRAIGMTQEDVKAEMDKLDRYFTITSWSESDKKANDRKLWVDFLQLLFSEYKLVENGRREKMNSVNPRFVLRNHVAQRAITQAERGDFVELNKVLEMCLDPFNDDDSKWTDPKDGFKYDAPSEDVEEMCAVSCSS